MESRSYMRALMLGLTVGFAAITLPATTLGGDDEEPPDTTDPNFSVEPGSGCAALSGLDCSAIHGVVLQGEGVVVNVNQGPISLVSGRVEQRAPDGCFIQVEKHEVLLDAETFDSLRAHELRRLCLDRIDLEGEHCARAGTTNFAEILAACGLMRGQVEGDSAFFVQVIMLPIDCKQ